MTTDDKGRPLGSRLDRRSVLRGTALGGAGLAAAALLGCGSNARQAAPKAGAPVPSLGSQSTGSEAQWDYTAAAKADGAPFPYGFPEPAGEPQRGGTIVQSNPTLALGPWDVTKSTASSSLIVPNTTGSRLLGFKGGPALNKYKAEIQGDLATSWELSPDGLTYTFKLARNVKYHNVAPLNGRQFTAKDVLFTYQRFATAAASTSNFFVDMESISAPDEYTVQIKLKRPYPDFIIPLATRALPMQASELVERNLLDKNPIGTGSLIFKDIDATGNYNFVANPEFFQGKPFADGLQYKAIVDPAAYTAAFRAGQIDFPVSGAPTKLDADALLRSNPETRIACNPVFNVSNGLAFNLRNPKFADIRVRRAISLALDRPGVIQKALGGYGLPGTDLGWTFVFDKYPQGDEFGKWWRYDPKESAALLAAAGQTGLEFNWIVQAPVSSTYQAYQDALRQNGITGKFQGQPSGSYLNVWSTSPAPKGPTAGPSAYPEAIGITFNAGTPGSNFWYNDRIRSDSPANHFNIDDAQVDQWVTAAKSEIDPRKKRDLLKNVWDRVQDNVWRVEGVGGFSFEVQGPRLRWVRFQGPYLAFYGQQDWGSQFAKTWLVQK